MESLLSYQDAIHRAMSVDEVGDLLRRFFASFDETESHRLDHSILAIATFSERGLQRKAGMAKLAGTTPAIAAEKVLSTAALRVEVLNMDVRARKRGWLHWWRRPR